jgi:hypothetical protein
MRKLIFTFAAFLLIGVATIKAQDTLNTNKPKPENQSSYQQDVPKNYFIMKTDDVPASVRTTLREDEYTGWEAGTFYQNRSTNQYLLRVGTGNDVKSYYFDKTGRRVKEPNQRK